MVGVSGDDCVVDVEEIRHMLALYRRGWAVVIVSQSMVECFAALYPDQDGRLTISGGNGAGSHG